MKVSADFQSLVPSLHADQQQRWRRGEQKLVEEYLQEHPELNSQPEIVLDLIYSEFRLQQEFCRATDRSEYHRRFPELSDDLQRLFEVDAALEGFTATRPEFTESSNEVLPSTASFRSNSHLNSATRSLPIFIGKYQILNVVGQGAFGTVYRARDPELDRVVALKVPHTAKCDDTDYLDRCTREARAAARLDHPGIVRVYDVVYGDDGAFLVSEFVEGVTLAKEIARRKTFEFRDAATLVAGLADALDYAHGMRVVHRDLKPSNIVLQRPAASPASRKSEPESDVIARILDFGLARREGIDATLTQEGQILGTPAYMSPEQARGEAQLSDSRSDIFSLGVIFYELLCGHVPFVGSTHRLLQQVAFEEVPDIRRQRQDVPRDLAVICHRCLQNDPSRRYQTAAAVSSDLRRWLKSMPILARPVGRLERAQLWCRRNRRLAYGLAISITILISLCLLIAVLIGSSVDEKRSRAAHLIGRLEIAPSRELPALFREIRNTSSEQLLRQVVEDSEKTIRHRGRSALALDPKISDYTPTIMEWLLEAEPQELPLICRQLADREETMNHHAKLVLTDATATRSQWLRAAGACLLLDPGSLSSAFNLNEFVNRLVEEPEADIEGWGNIIATVPHLFRARLFEVLQDIDDSDRRSKACVLLTRVNVGNPTELAKMFACLRPQECKPVIEALRKCGSSSPGHVANHLSAVNAKYELPGTDKEALAREMANHALALFELDNSVKFSSGIFHNKADPRAREYFIEGAAALGMADALWNRLSNEKDADVQYALLVTLGQYDLQALSERNREPLRAWLRDTYSTHNDCGIHSAAGWLLKRWGHERLVKELDQKLIKEGIVPGRNWLVTPLGFTMLLVEGPVTFNMGASPEEASPPAFEARHVHRIPWSFAISTTEISRDQYRQAEKSFTTASPSRSMGDDPEAGISCCDAIEFCATLNAGQTPDQEMTIVQMQGGSYRIDFQRNGYRLPTSAEWEFVCRAGSETPRFCGHQATPGLSRYAWWTSDQNRSIAVGSKAPNRWGLFNVYGNAQEWVATLGRWNESLPQEDPATTVISEEDVVYLRGGSFDRREVFFLSAMAVPMQANGVLQTGGFRIARTLK